MLRDTLEAWAQPSNSRPPGHSPTGASHSEPPTWEPTRPQPQRGHTRPPHPMRSPAPPPVSVPSVKFRPDKPRQPELLRQLEERNPQPKASQRQPSELKTISSET